MKKQRVTIKEEKRSLNSFRLLSVFLLVIVSLLMTGTSGFLYKYGLDPLQFYSNLANPYMKLVNIPAGLRREETARKFAKILSWDEENIADFLKTAPRDDQGTLDGYYLPGAYWVKTTATGSDVAHQMLRNFNSRVSAEILNKGTKGASSGASGAGGLGGGAGGVSGGTAKAGNTSFNKAQKINLDTAVRVASIIQREAAGKQDMNLISGVIWNRIFKGMSLDMDATLQYAKVEQQDAGQIYEDINDGASTTTVWWPKVASKDKYIDSPFNTYQNKGLPPTAIANPSIQAIAAAFNPTKTDCLFYLHDDYRNIHCSKTYSAHKENVQKYLIGSR